MVVAAAGVAGLSDTACITKPDEMCEACDDLNLATFACYGGLIERYRGSVCLEAWQPEHVVLYECGVQHGSTNGAVLWPCEGMADTSNEPPADEGIDDGEEGGVDDGVDASDGGNISPDATCDGWDPGSHISIVNSRYYVEQDFIDALIAHPFPLTECDGATLTPAMGSGGGYVVGGAVPGTLLYELGLRNSEVVHSINGMPLNSMEDAADALAALYLYATTLPTYTLSYALPSGAPKQRKYLVVP